MAGDAFRYDGKRVVVTGGASGVGAALVALLSELGAARITVLDRKPPSGSVAYLETDLGDPGSIDAAASAIDGRVDALFNNAGVAATKPTPVVLDWNGTVRWTKTGYDESYQEELLRQIGELVEEFRQGMQSTSGSPQAEPLVEPTSAPAP